MKKQFIDFITDCEPWHFIQAEKEWRISEVLACEVPGANDSKVLLPTSLILGCFQDLAAWLIMFSSKFELTGSVERIDQFSILKEKVKPEHMRFELWADFSSNSDKVKFSGRLLINGETIALINSLVMNYVLILNPDYGKECYSQWKILRHDRNKTDNP